MRADWGQGGVEVGSAEALDAVLGTVRGLGEPTMVLLEEGPEGEGAWCVVGLGYPVAFLGWGRLRGASFHSVGFLPPLGGLSFSFKGRPLEVASEYAIPEADALAAVREFFRTRARPTCVKWEEDR